MSADYVFWVAVAWIVGCNFYFGPRIKGDRIAMQWGLDGKPTWYAPKGIALWGMVAFMLAVRWLIWIAMTYYPAWVHDPEIGLLGLSVILAATQLFVLMKATVAD